MPKMDGGFEVIEMPEQYMKEMLADWRGMAREFSEGDHAKKWYEANYDNMILGPETRRWIDYMILGRL